MKKLILVFPIALVCLMALAADRRALLLERNQAAASSTLNDSLIAYWKMDEASGTREDAFAANDLTDNNTVTSATGKIGDAGDFEKDTTEYLNKTGTWAQLTGDFTVSAWVNCETLEIVNIGQGVMRCLNGEAIGDWMVTIDSGQVNLLHWSASGSDADGKMIVTESTITTATWFHIVGRLSGGTYTIWINGVSKAFTTAATSTGWGNVGFEMGRAFTSASYHFDGLIDEAAIWSRGLSDLEIAELYNTGSGKTCCPFAP